jgi:hypothetical protein
LQQKRGAAHQACECGAKSSVMPSGNSSARTRRLTIRQMGICEHHTSLQFSGKGGRRSPITLTILEAVKEWVSARKESRVV